jgi:hypothetical protein
VLYSGLLTQASPLDPVFALIARHRAEQQSYGDALMAQYELDEIIPKEIQRSGRVKGVWQAGNALATQSPGSNP